MRKYLLITVTIILESSTIFSQNPEAMKKDSLRIDSLIKKIPATKDTARINYLTKLSWKILLTSYPQKTKADQALPYVEMAYREAKQAGYQIGIAKSLMLFCGITTNNFRYNRRNNLDNTETLKKNEAYLNELLEIANKINDPEILGDAYEEESSFWFRKQNNQKILEANKKALYWYKKSGNENAECATNYTIASTYLITGEFENAFEYSKRALELAKKLSVKSNRDSINYDWLQPSLINMSDLYKAAGDYESAMNLLQESRQFHATQKSTDTWGMEMELADLFLYTGQYDSTIHYLMGIENKNYLFYWPILADAYLKLNKPDSALKYYDLAIDSMEKIRLVPNAIGGLKRVYLGKARILSQQKKNKEALKYAKKSLYLNQQRLTGLDVLNAYESISKLFHQIGNDDSAYAYLVKYNELKESMITRHFLFRLNNYIKEADELKKTSQLNLLNKDNQIKEQKLKQQAIVKNGLIIGLLLLLLAGVFIFKSILLKRKKQQAEHQKKQTELEMQALRAQMNPHFIFNCLSSINKYILKNEPDTASDYLTRFSRLIRMVLMNSQRSLITLEDELDMLTIYLDMERMRFKNAFNYNIIFANRVDADAIFIPPLLLQPFCENAIWHGLKPLVDHEQINHEPGRLDIVLHMEAKVLNCSITDNGIGRKKAAEIRSKSAEEKKSLGLKITTERLALLNQEKGISTSYEIIDLYDENAGPDGKAGRGHATGTKVNLKISYKETVEEIA